MLRPNSSRGDKSSGRGRRRGRGISEDHNIIGVNFLHD